MGGKQTQDKTKEREEQMDEAALKNASVRVRPAIWQQAKLNALRKNMPLRVYLEQLIEADTKED